MSTMWRSLSNNNAWQKNKMKDKKTEFLKLMTTHHLEKEYIPERKSQLKFLEEQAKSIRDILVLAEEELLDRKTKP